MAATFVMLSSRRNPCRARPWRARERASLLRANARLARVKSVVASLHSIADVIPRYAYGGRPGLRRHVGRHDCFN
jgi:hypothetical protein